MKKNIYVLLLFGYALVMHSTFAAESMETDEASPERTDLTAANSKAPGTSKITTCEFDLAAKFWANQPDNNYHPFPPQLYKDKCEALYRFPEQNNFEREKLFEEASIFAQWLSALQAYETKVSGKPTCANGVYYQDIKFRIAMYNAAKIWECYKLRDNILFLGCMVNRRKKMLAMIPKN